MGYDWKRCWIRSTWTGTGTAWKWAKKRGNWALNRNERHGVNISAGTSFHDASNRACRSLCPFWASCINVSLLLFSLPFVNAAERTCSVQGSCVTWEPVNRLLCYGTVFGRNMRTTALIINRQMHLHFTLKHLKSLRHVSILRSPSGSYVVPC